jgi:hypothetical protein
MFARWAELYGVSCKHLWGASGLNATGTRSSLPRFDSAIRRKSWDDGEGRLGLSDERICQSTVDLGFEGGD